MNCEKDAIQRRDEALELAQRYRSSGEAGHRAWVIDQMCRTLLGDEYDQWVLTVNAAQLGTGGQPWNTGTAPPAQMVKFETQPPLSGKGRSPLADHQAQADALIAEYRHALSDGLGKESDSFSLIVWVELLGLSNVGFAYSEERAQAFLLFADNDQLQHPSWMEDIAKELSERARTKVLPDSQSSAPTYWSGLHRGPIVSCRFNLVDPPATLRI